MKVWFGSTVAMGYSVGRYSPREIGGSVLLRLRYSLEIDMLPESVGVPVLNCGRRCRHQGVVLSHVALNAVVTSASGVPNSSPSS